jgi:type III restriction enzyme
MPVVNPILNHPYEPPRRHYHTAADGSLDYGRILDGRRVYRPEMSSLPVGSGPQGDFGEWLSDDACQAHLINLLRREVGAWRDSSYQQPASPTRVTRELLHFWFDPARSPQRRLFFAQREAIETAIYLNEIAERANVGTHILNLLRIAQTGVSDNAVAQLPRIAFKMATGTGKTVVMAALLLYHYGNRQEYRHDPRFADAFLIVAPGITIKDRLSVLYADTDAPAPHLARDYYRQRDLLPNGSGWKDLLDGLNARLKIVNYHAFEPRALQGNQRSPLDGKRGPDGKKTEAKESPTQMLKRVLGGAFKPDSRLLVINDEAHHCYLPKAGNGNRRGGDDDDGQNNDRAARWFSGLMELGRRFKLTAVYDLSATPYFLSGSGYRAYELFPWVVSDFGLVEAIESGLVKIPFLPGRDNTQQLDMPVLLNLYDHIKDGLPGGSRRARKTVAATDSSPTTGEPPPQLPGMLISALDQFHGHYQRMLRRRRGLFETPPVFIVVCANTVVSKEVYKHIAGYERTLPDGSAVIAPGCYEEFSNFDPVTRQPRSRPPTLLIDSAALDEATVIDEAFKTIFAPEIAAFKRAYRLTHPQQSVEEIDDGDLLREVLNSVGKTGTLGAQVRCVVSVAMLTEGWDTKTVTHIVGIRAFASQLLCEQVAGRALRREHYDLRPYTLAGEQIADKDLHRYKPDNVIWKFPPEYAYLIGVPFQIFPGGDATPAIEVKPPDWKEVRALPERQAAYEITFPNVTAYRVLLRQDTVTADFSGLPPFLIDGTRWPLVTIMEAFGQQEPLSVREALAGLREQTVIYRVTRAALRAYFSDADGNPDLSRFPALRAIVETWYRDCVQVIGVSDSALFKKALWYLIEGQEKERVCQHLFRGITQHPDSVIAIQPLLDRAGPMGSTRHVFGRTARPVYKTIKSHVNGVVADTDQWEQIAAKTLEDLPFVLSYVKNAFLDFRIPYASGQRERFYEPDFIVRCQTPQRKEPVSLLLEMTGFSREKEDKKAAVKDFWLPAINQMDGQPFGEWGYLEIAGEAELKNMIQLLEDKVRQWPA